MILCFETGSYYVLLDDPEWPVWPQTHRRIPASASHELAWTITPSHIDNFSNLHTDSAQKNKRIGKLNGNKGPGGGSACL